MEKYEKHFPVLLEEVIEFLAIKKDGIYVDCTVGAGGHSVEILKKIPLGKLLIIDEDPKALKIAEEKLKKIKGDFVSYRGNFKNLKEIIGELLDGMKVDGILVDLGVSSMQLDEADRGFSFKGDAKLDMRFNPENEIDACKIVNQWSGKELERIFREYGEERFSKKISKKIVELRKEGTIENTSELRKIIESTIPKKFWPKKIHPATKVFQALRIAVNDELGALKKLLEESLNLLKVGGRLEIISFHSLEDRIVKQFYKNNSKDCSCPPDFPICNCETYPHLKIITKKPITASENEIKQNNRSRSAKLRVCEKIRD